MQHNNILSVSGYLVHSIGDGLGRIGGRGKYLQDTEPGILKPDAVSKGTAAVDGDSERSAGVRRRRSPGRGSALFANSQLGNCTILNEFLLWEVRALNLELLRL